MGRILVVDDEIAICNLLRQFLTSKGYEVYTAPDGQTAIARVRELRPHIVLLDIMMPGMGGIDTLKEIKKVDPRVAVIMLTAIGKRFGYKFSPQEDQDYLPVEDFIEKPVGPRELLRRVEALLGKPGQP